MILIFTKISQLRCFIFYDINIYQDFAATLLYFLWY